MFQAERKILRPIKLAIEKVLWGNEESPLAGVFIGVIQEKISVVCGKQLAQLGFDLFDLGKKHWLAHSDLAKILCTQKSPPQCGVSPIGTHEIRTSHSLPTYIFITFTMKVTNRSDIYGRRGKSRQRHTKVSEHVLAAGG